MSCRLVRDTKVGALHLRATPSHQPRPDFPSTPAARRAKRAALQGRGDGRPNARRLLPLEKQPRCDVQGHSQWPGWRYVAAGWRKAHRLLPFASTRILGHNIPPLPGDYSTKFSAWLAHGCITSRYIYHEVQQIATRRLRCTLDKPRPSRLLKSSSPHWSRLPATRPSGRPTRAHTGSTLSCSGVTTFDSSRSSTGLSCSRKAAFRRRSCPGATASWSSRCVQRGHAAVNDGEENQDLCGRKLRFAEENQEFVALR